MSHVSINGIACYRLERALMGRSVGGIGGQSTLHHSVLALTQPTQKKGGWGGEVTGHHGFEIGELAVRLISRLWMHSVTRIERQRTLHTVGSKQESRRILYYTAIQPHNEPTIKSPTVSRMALHTVQLGVHRHSTAT